MRRPAIFLLTFLLSGAALSASAASGKVVKVLPHFLDLQGRHALSPSLYDRDAYQAQLRKNPEKRSGVRFDILWRGRSAKPETVLLRVEVRGTAKGNLPSQAILEIPVRITGTSHWEQLALVGEKYQAVGEITAWRVTLVGSEGVIGEQKSFLW